MAADIIVTATGLNMRLFGGTKITRNGQAVDIAKSMTYKAMMPYPMSRIWRSPSAAITRPGH